MMGRGMSKELERHHGQDFSSTSRGHQPEGKGNHITSSLQGARGARQLAKGRAHVKRRACFFPSIFLPLFHAAPVSAQLTVTSLDSVGFEQCRLWLSISDLDRNDRMNNDPEYIRYLNYWTGDGFGITSFQDLPPILIANFKAYARVDGEVALLGDQPDIPTLATEAAFLLDLCEATRTSLKIGLGLTPAPTLRPTTPPPTTKTPAPTDTPTEISSKIPPQSTPTGPFPPIMTPGATQMPTNFNGPEGPIDPTDPPGTTPVEPTEAPQSMPTFQPVYTRVTFAECRIFLAVSDVTRDNFVDPEEYVRFINRIGMTAYESFDAMPFIIRAAFNNLSTDRRIDIFGSRPGQELTTQQEVFLQQVCAESENAVIEAGGFPVAPLISVAPTPGSPPGLTSEASPITGPVGSPVSSPTIPTVPPPETVVPTAAPPAETEAPETKTPAVVPSTEAPEPRVTIHSSFNIINSNGIEAADLEDPQNPNREGLTRAYGNMVQDVLKGQDMAEGTNEGPENDEGDPLANAFDDVKSEARVAIESITDDGRHLQQQSRRRRLVASLVPGSLAMYSFVDADCANTAPDLPKGAVYSCQTAYAGYDVSLNEDEDPQLLYDRLVADTQAAIEKGELQQQLDAEQPDSQVAVTGANRPVEAPETDGLEPAIPTPTMSPPTVSPKSGEDSITNEQLAIVLGSIAGALSLVVIAACVLCVGIYLCSRNSKTKPYRPYDPHSSSHYGSPSRRSLRRRPSSRKQDPLAAPPQSEDQEGQFSDEEIGMDGNKPDEVGNLQLVVTGPKQQQPALAPPPQENNPPTPQSTPPGEAGPPTPPASNKRGFQPPQLRDSLKDNNDVTDELDPPLHQYQGKELELLSTLEDHKVSSAHPSYGSVVLPPQADINHSVSPTPPQPSQRPPRPTQQDAIPTQLQGPVQPSPQLSVVPARNEREHVRYYPPGSNQRPSNNRSPNRPQAGKRRFFSQSPRPDQLDPTTTPTPAPQPQHATVPTPSPSSEGWESVSPPTVVPTYPQVFSPQALSQQVPSPQAPTHQTPRPQTPVQLVRSPQALVQQAQQQGPSPQVPSPKVPGSQGPIQQREQVPSPTKGHPGPPQPALYRRSSSPRDQQRQQLEQMVEEIENESFTENLNELLHEIEDESTSSEFGSEDEFVPADLASNVVAEDEDDIFDSERSDAESDRSEEDRVRFPLSSPPPPPRPHEVSVLAVEPQQQRPPLPPLPQPAQEKKTEKPKTHDWSSDERKEKQTTIAKEESSESPTKVSKSSKSKGSKSSKSTQGLKRSKNKEGKVKVQEEMAKAEVAKQDEETVDKKAAQARKDESGSNDDSEADVKAPTLIPFGKFMEGAAPTPSPEQKVQEQKARKDDSDSNNEWESDSDDELSKSQEDAKKADDSSSEDESDNSSGKDKKAKAVSKPAGKKGDGSRGESSDEESARDEKAMTATKPTPKNKGGGSSEEENSGEDSDDKIAKTKGKEAAKKGEDYSDGKAKRKGKAPPKIAAEKKAKKSTLEEGSGDECSDNEKKNKRYAKTKGDESSSEEESSDEDSGEKKIKGKPPTKPAAKNKAEESSSEEESSDEESDSDDDKKKKGKPPAQSAAKKVDDSSSEEESSDSDSDDKKKEGKPAAKRAEESSSEEESSDEDSGSESENPKARGKPPPKKKLVESSSEEESSDSDDDSDSESEKRKAKGAPPLKKPVESSSEEESSDEGSSEDGKAPSAPKAAAKKKDDSDDSSDEDSLDDASSSTPVKKGPAPAPTPKAAAKKKFLDDSESEESSSSDDSSTPVNKAPGPAAALAPTSKPATKKNDDSSDEDSSDKESSEFETDSSS